MSLVSRTIFFVWACVFFFACMNQDTHHPESADMKIHDVSIPALAPASLPHLFPSPDGQVFLSWLESRGDSSFLKFTSLTDSNFRDAGIVAQGRGWFVNWADYPQMATDGKGHYLATFLKYSDTGHYTYDVYYTTSSDGHHWETPRPLHNDGVKAEHGFVSLLPWQEGFLVSWLDGRNAGSETGHEHSEHQGSAMTLRVAHLNFAGIKMKEWEIDDRVCDCCQTSLTLTARGPALVYRDRTTEEVRNISFSNWNGEGWTKPRDISKDGWKIEGCPVNGPRLDAIGDRLASLWFTGAGGSSKVFLQFSEDSGESFLPPMQISDSASLGRVDLAWVDSGKVAATYMQDSTICLRLIQAGSSPGPVISVATTSMSRKAGFPQLCSTKGQIWVAWTDTREQKIRVARMDSNSGH